MLPKTRRGWKHYFRHSDAFIKLQRIIHRQCI